MTGKAEPLEDIAASLLNGVMVFLAGAAPLIVLIWLVVTGPRDWIRTPDFGSTVEVGQGITFVVFSVCLMKWGAQTIWKNVAALRRRGSATG